MAIEALEKYRKEREELETAIERGEVGDPITGTIFTIATLKALAISAAVSAATFFVGKAFQPKPPRVQLGKLQGSLQLQNSEQGIFIPEIYGASPTISTVAGSNPTYQNVVNAATGANGSITKNVATAAWDAGASHNTSISSGQEAFFQFIVGTGYAVAGFTLDSSPSTDSDFLFGIQWNPDGSI